MYSVFMMLFVFNLIYKIGISIHTKVLLEAEVRLSDETPLAMGTAVDVTNNNPVKFLMMDGPSTGINDFKLKCNSKEVERIRNMIK